MHSAFGTVVLVVCAVGVVGAVLALALGRDTWDRYGRDHPLHDSDANPDSEQQRDEEIRQLRGARDRARARRGAPVSDRAVTSAAPGSVAVDPELEAEIRQLVGARNHRRARRGEPPLDVEAEVRRQLDSLAPRDPGRAR